MEPPPPEYNLLYFLIYFGITIQYFASGNDSRTYHQILEKMDSLSYCSVSKGAGKFKGLVYVTLKSPEVSIFNCI